MFGSVCFDYGFLYSSGGTFCDDFQRTQEFLAYVNVDSSTPIGCASSALYETEECMMLTSFTELRLFSRQCSEAQHYGRESKNLDSVLTPEFMLSKVLAGMAIEYQWLCAVLRRRYEVLEDETTGYPKLNEAQMAHRHAILGVIEGISAAAQSGEVLVFYWERLS